MPSPAAPAAAAVAAVAVAVAAAVAVRVCCSHAAADAHTSWRHATGRPGCAHLLLAAGSGRAHLTVIDLGGTG